MSVEKIELNSDVMELSEKITELIRNHSEKIDKNTEKMPEKIRYRGQRGTDNKKRQMNPKSLRNLKSYRDLPQVPQKTSHLSNWLMASVSIMALGIIIWIIYRKYQKEEE